MTGTRRSAARGTVIRERLRSAFWLIPAVCCTSALVLGVALPEFDQLVSDELPFLFAGGPDGARTLLSSIATSMISFTGLVFSITVVSLQLASGQFSPRVLRSFLRSRVTQSSLGVFIATALYALVVLRSVRGNVGVEPFVPQLAVTTAALLLVVSFVLFIVYISHITQALQISTIVENVREETARLLERTLGDDDGAPVAARRTAGRTLEVAGRALPSTEPGVLVGIDIPTLVAEASQGDAQLDLAAPLGGFVAEGMPLLWVHGPPGGVDDDALREAVTLAQERSMAQDAAFGFRQLVDIAEKALSPGINDPTTAVQALDALHDLLRRLAVRPDPVTEHADDDGTLRLRTREPAFPDYLDLALDEVLQYGAQSRQVVTRVRRLLDDLLTAARLEHLPALQRKQVQVQQAEAGQSS